ncbi:cytochrome P450 76A1 [Olea europaea subsp. europaea]|uniref:Cytochrome P450 76A1 n=1 Tax=Olea europaea subsp. europaea TaxID=158383 RepID=A0A8S0QWZ7_OLEEU|nr:cytochrome P450 76A1 [Olea europaea subsp. europaea]
MQSHVNHAFDVVGEFLQQRLGTMENDCIQNKIRDYLDVLLEYQGDDSKRSHAFGPKTINIIIFVNFHLLLAEEETRQISCGQFVCLILPDFCIFVNVEPDSEPLVHFSLVNDESIGLMVDGEMEHLSRDDYLSRLKTGDSDMGVRREVVDWVCKVK